jgi:hypothetical protein
MKLTRIEAGRLATKALADDNIPEWVDDFIMDLRSDIWELLTELSAKDRELAELRAQVWRGHEEDKDKPE